jgi:soluble lytic murein transglycosylase
LASHLWCARRVRELQDDDFLAARDAFRSGDAVRLERSARSLAGYILEPYVAYWKLKLRLENAAPAEVQALLERSKDGPVSNSLRSDWLKLLGMRQQWDLFDAEYPQLIGEDSELSCYALQSRLRGGSAEALSSAQRVVHRPRSA